MFYRRSPRDLRATAFRRRKVRGRLRKMLG
jgi:hypothetical protein